MVIKINGKDETIEDGATLIKLILNKGIVPGRVVIEHNYRIIPKNEWQDTVVKENDAVEIISFMGGG